VIAASIPYRNNAGGRDEIKTNLFSSSVSLAAGKTVASVTLPSHTDAGAIHVFAIALK
jgi:hypothetical protein